MATLGEAVKLAARAQRSASKPAAWMFGEVLAVSPLRILVDDRFEVGADQVVLMREFVAGSMPPIPTVLTRTPTRCRSILMSLPSRPLRRRTGTAIVSRSRLQRALP